MGSPYAKGCWSERNREPRERWTAEASAREPAATRAREARARVAGTITLGVSFAGRGATAGPPAGVVITEDGCPSSVLSALQTRVLPFLPLTTTPPSRGTRSGIHRAIFKTRAQLSCDWWCGCGSYSEELNPAPSQPFGPPHWAELQAREKRKRRKREELRKEVLNGHRQARSV